MGPSLCDIGLYRYLYPYFVSLQDLSRQEFALAIFRIRCHFTDAYAEIRPASLFFYDRNAAVWTTAACAERRRDRTSSWTLEVHSERGRVGLDHRA